MKKCKENLILFVVLMIGMIAIAYSMYSCFTGGIFNYTETNVEAASIYDGVCKEADELYEMVMDSIPEEYWVMECYADLYQDYILYEDDPVSFVEFVEIIENLVNDEIPEE